MFDSVQGRLDAQAPDVQFSPRKRTKEIWTKRFAAAESSADADRAEQLRWFGDVIVFQQPVPNETGSLLRDQGRRSSAKPFNLITTDGMVEGATSVDRSRATADDVLLHESQGHSSTRHIWSVRRRAASRMQLTVGRRHRDVTGRHGVRNISGSSTDGEAARARGVVPAAGGTARAIEKLPKEFPLDAHVVPQIVHTKAVDGVDISNELFLPPT